MHSVWRLCFTDVENDHGKVVARDPVPVWQFQSSMLAVFVIHIRMYYYSIVDFVVYPCVFLPCAQPFSYCTPSLGPAISPFPSRIRLVRSLVSQIRKLERTQHNTYSRASIINSNRHNKHKLCDENITSSWWECEHIVPRWVVCTVRHGAASYRRSLRIAVTVV